MVDFMRRSVPVRRMLVISVDGQSATDPALSQERMVNGLVQIFDAVSGAQIDNYNLETLAMIQAEMDRMMVRQRENRCRHARVIDGRRCDDAHSLLARVSLADVEDPALRDRLRRVPTGLTLPRGDVDALVAAGEMVIRRNREIAAFLADDTPPR